MPKEQFNYWSHTHLTVDVVDGRGSGFSVEAPEGRRFLFRSRLVEGFEPGRSAHRDGQIIKGRPVGA